MAESRKVVIAALIANGGIAILKFFGYLLTGSASMLSEAYHSVSDTGNQILLLVGLRYSSGGRTDHHPFGRGKAQFFYSLLVSVFLFGVAGLTSALHGWEAIQKAGEHAHESAEVIIANINFTHLIPVETFWVNIAVLLGAMVFEVYAFSKAYTAIKKQQRKRGWKNIIETFKKTPDVTTLTALTEDTVALLGLIFAFFGIIATRITGNTLYDAVAALFIGILLMITAIALAWENKRLILGECLPKKEENELKDLIKNTEGINQILDFRTVYFGPDRIVVTMGVDFDDSLSIKEVEKLIRDLTQKMKNKHKDIYKIYIEPEAKSGK